MMPRLLGVAACLLAFAAGAPWWTITPAAALFLLGQRWALLPALVLNLAFLPAGQGFLADVLAVAAGMLAASSVLLRLGGRWPWVALPVAGALVVALAVLWPVLPPSHFWVDSDVAVRVRLGVLMLLALVLMTLTYPARE